MNEATQNAVAMALIAAGCTIAGQFIGWLRDRDKLRYDNELLALKSQNTTQAGQIATLTSTQAECERKHEECEKKHRTTEVRIEQIEVALARKKDETAEHVPLPK